LAIGSGGKLTIFPGLTCHRSPIPYVEFNAANVTDPSLITDEVLREVHQFFDEVYEWFFVVPPKFRRAFERVMTEIRVLRFGRKLGMTLTLNASTVERLRPAPAELEIMRVTDLDRLQMWATTLSIGNDADPEFLGPLAGPAYLDEPRLTTYLGLVAGEPVATSVLFASDGIAGVYAVNTIPKFRGRGYGAAMSAVTLGEGLSLGCDTAALQASGMGYPVYFRMGFRYAFDYQCWWVGAKPVG
jgi:GNAT superfamily N-acetyltransferase